MSSYLYIYNLVLVLYLVSLLSSALLVLSRFSSMDKPTRIVGILLITGLLNEVAADRIVRIWGNNQIPYFLYNFANLILTSLYFNYSVPAFRKKNAGYIIAIIGITSCMLSSFYNKGTRLPDQYYLYLESILITGMSLFSLLALLQGHNRLRLAMNPHFWISATILFNYTTTISSWGLLDMVAPDNSEALASISIGLLSVNAITYAAFTLILFFYPKMSTYAY